MRFTSPDPAASPFCNLFAYCGNSPGAFFDPDGLEADERSGTSKFLDNALNLWGAGDWLRPTLKKLDNFIGEPATYQSQDKALDQLQTQLSVGGTIPGFGIVFDLADAGISLMRGNYAEAGLAAMAAVPIIGDFAGAGRVIHRINKLRKLASKADDAADALKTANKVINKADDVAGAGRRGGDIVRHVANDAPLPKDDLAILKSIRRHAERLVSGKAAASNVDPARQVVRIQKHFRAGRHGAAGSMFHSLNFRYAGQAQKKGFLLNMEIEARVASAGIGRRKYRKPDYLFDHARSYDLKSFRPDRAAYNSSEQFRDIATSTGHMPVPLYYKLRVR
jgi:hypothetical protein